VVGEAADAKEVVRLAEGLKPDVVVMDLDLQNGSSFDAIGEIKARLPGKRIIALSVLKEEAYRQGARKYQADAFVPKDTPISAILTAIRHDKHDKPTEAAGGEKNRMARFTLTVSSGRWPAKAYENPIFDPVSGELLRSPRIRDESPPVGSHGRVTSIAGAFLRRSSRVLRSLLNPKIFVFAPSFAISAIISHRLICRAM